MFAKVSKTLFSILMTCTFLVGMVILVPQHNVFAAVQQSFTTGDTDSYDFQDSTWEAQGFQTTSGYTVSGVRLKLHRSTAYSGTVTVSIRENINIAGNYFPAASDLCAGTIGSNAIIDNGDGDWYLISMFDSVAGGTALAANSHYAIVVRATGDADGIFGWRYNGAPYDSEQRCISYDAGVSWMGIPSQGFMFEVHDNTGCGDTKTSVVSSKNPAVYCEPVTFTATVSATSPVPSDPTGSVEFFDGTTSLGTVTLSSPTAKIIVSNLSSGNHVITAKYTGDDSFNPSTSSPITQVVN
ncbi:Ig-like domain-containing protein, partial [Chloroflexota bacterium]